MKRLAAAVLIMVTLWIPCSLAQGGSRPPPDQQRKISELIAKLRANPLDDWTCVQLRFEYATRSGAAGSRTFAEDHPDLARTCEQARAAQVAADAKRAADWRPDFPLWLKLMFQGFLLGMPVGLAYALLLRRGSVASFLVPVAAAGAAAALLEGGMNVSIITQNQTMRLFSLETSLWLGELAGAIGLRSGGGSAIFALPFLGPVFPEDIVRGLAAGTIGLGLLPISKFADFSQLYRTPQDAGASQSVWVFPATLVAGLLIAALGYWYGPRDYSGLKPEGGLIVAVGLLLAASTPFGTWRQTASRNQYLITAGLLAAANLSAMRWGRPTTGQSFLLLASWLLVFFLARDGIRLLRVQNRGLIRASRFAFAWPFSSSPAISQAAGRLDPEHLVGALHLAEHTPHARQAIRDELQRRGIPNDDATTDWLPEPRRATLGPAVAKSIEPARYARFVRNRKRMISAVRAVALTGIVTVVGVLVLAPVMLLLVMIGGFLGRKRAARILLLRPFGQAEMTRALKRVVRDHLGRVGHVFTLSDRNYRPNFVLDGLNRVFDWVLLFLGPLLRPSIRIANVKSERTFLALADILLRRWRPSWIGLMSADQAFNLRTTDDWWKRCVDLLMRSCDLVVMDISRISSGSAWEISQLAARGQLQDCVFICQDVYLEESLAGLKQLLGSSFAPQVLTFDSEGVFPADTAARIDATIDSRICGAAAAWGK